MTGALKQGLLLLLIFSPLPAPFTVPLCITSFPCSCTFHSLYHCFSDFSSRVPLSQIKTCTLTTITIQACTRITVTIQYMYTYHCHNTKRVHVPVSQHKIRIRNPVTMRNMYTYPYHNTKCVHIPLSKCKTIIRSHVNTKHVHVPYSQYKTCTRTTVTIQACTRTIVTIQNMYTYHC